MAYDDDEVIPIVASFQKNDEKGHTVVSRYRLSDDDINASDLNARKARKRRMTTLKQVMSMRLLMLRRFSELLIRRPKARRSQRRGPVWLVEVTLQTSYDRTHLK